MPGAKVSIVRTIGDLEEIGQRGDAIQFVICSRERAKLSYRWVPAVVRRPLRGQGQAVRGEDGAIAEGLCCPTCFVPLTDDEQVPVSWSDLRKKKQRCRACRGPLWQADRTGPRRLALADYVRRRMPGYFDLLILDEGHEYKARGSAQGLAAEGLAGACRRTLTLTGTLFGGYSSTLFYLLWRFSPAVRQEFGYRDEQRWISRYGLVERITSRNGDRYGEDGRHSKRRSYLTRIVEKPGVSPAILLHLIGNTVFLRLSDVASDLPSFAERVVTCALDSGNDRDEPSQLTCYRRLASDLRQATVAALHAGSKRLLAAYLQALLAYPDACIQGERVLDALSGAVIAHAPPLAEATLYPKERALLELALQQRARGRRLLVYITHTERRDISPRLRAILEQHGLRVAVLKADTVPADRREEWLLGRVNEGADVLVCHPRLVQTGLDLIDWPSICWYEIEYSTYVTRQASRRSWRIGQSRPVEVTYLAYEGTLQVDALRLVAAKTRSSLMIEGELPTEGLSAQASDGDDVLLDLARRLADQNVPAAESCEAPLDHVGVTESDADALLSPTTGDIADSHPDVVDPEKGGPEPLSTTSSSASPAESHSTDSGQSGSPGPVFTLLDLGRVGQPVHRRRPKPAVQLDLFER